MEAEAVKGSLGLGLGLGPARTVPSPRPRPLPLAPPRPLPSPRPDRPLPRATALTYGRAGPRPPGQGHPKSLAAAGAVGHRAPRGRCAGLGAGSAARGPWGARRAGSGRPPARGCVVRAAAAPSAAAPGLRAPGAGGRRGGPASGEASGTSRRPRRLQVRRRHAGGGIGVLGSRLGAGRPSGTVSLCAHLLPGCPACHLSGGAGGSRSGLLLSFLSRRSLSFHVQYGGTSANRYF